MIRVRLFVGFFFFPPFPLDVLLGLSRRAKGGESNNTPELHLACGVVILAAEQGLAVASHILAEDAKQWRW